MTLELCSSGTTTYCYKEAMLCRYLFYSFVRFVWISSALSCTRHEYCPENSQLSRCRITTLWRWFLNEKFSCFSSDFDWALWPEERGRCVVSGKYLKTDVTEQQQQLGPLSWPCVLFHREPSVLLLSLPSALVSSSLTSHILTVLSQDGILGPSDDSMHLLASFFS